MSAPAKKKTAPPNAPKRRQEEEKFLEPESHQRLEEAVMDIFSSQDFHQANIRTVAKRAGVSFSTIYKYYGSKEGLLFAFVDKRLGVLTDRMIDHLQGIENLKEKLRKVFWVQLDYYERDLQLGRIIFMTVPLATWIKDRTFVQKKMYGMFLQTLRQGQEQGVLNNRVTPQVLLDCMHGLVERSFYMWIFRGQKYSLSGLATPLFEMLWRAITNPELPEIPS